MRLLNKIESYKYVISTSMFVLLFAFPIMRNALQSITVISFITISILFYYKNASIKLCKKNIWKNYLILTGFFWFSIITFIWTKNKDLFLNELQPTILIGILPFVILFIHPPIKEKQKQCAYLVFTLSLLAYLLHWFNYHIEGVSIYQEIILKEAPVRDLSIVDQLIYLKNHSYKTWVGGVAARGQDLLGYNSFFKHYTYVSSYFLFGIILSIYLLIKSKSIIIKTITIINTIFFLFLFSYLASKINILLLFLCLLSLLFFLKKRYVVIFICFLFILSFLGKNKITESFQSISSWTFFEEKDNNLDEKIIIDYKRNLIYKCGLEEIRKNYTLGIGLGDVQNYYNNCLAEKKFNINDEYNSHSQLLHFILVGGILNGVLFITAFLFLFKKAKTQKLLLLFFFTLIIFFNCLFENYLSRIYGVLFFTLFISIIPKWNLNEISKTRI